MESFPVILVYIFIFVFGSIIGSFITCYIWRAHNKIMVFSNRSQCVHCGRTLKWWENIPILSYFILGRRCSVCKKKIPLHYLHIEFFTGLLFVLVYWIDFEYFQASPWSVLRYFIMLSFLMMIFLGDLLYETIWSDIVWVGLGIGAIFNLALGLVSIEKMILGFLVIGSFFLLQYLVSKGRWIGGGDVRLGAMIGVWLGFPVAIGAVFIAYIAGAIIGLFLLVIRRKKILSALPLGCFLSVATLFALNHGQEIVDYFLAYWNKI